MFVNMFFANDTTPVVESASDVYDFVVKVKDQQKKFT